jgi:hypothetical protein
MGLGYGPTGPGSASFEAYSVVIDTLRQQNYVNSILFGLDLGTQGQPGLAESVQIVFGGLDKNKYSGKLAKIPVDAQDARYKVTLSEVAHRSPTSTTATTILNDAISVLVDSGTTLSFLPEFIVSSMASKFSGAKPDGNGGYEVPCCYQHLPGSIDFTFGNTKISVPYPEFIWNSGESCFLGAWHNSDICVFILCDSSLRGTYTVFDQDNHALYVGQYTSCADGSDLVAVSAGVDAAANIQGNCQSVQLSTTSNLAACTGTMTSATSSATGPILTNDNPNGPVPATTSSEAASKPTSTTSGTSLGPVGPTRTSSSVSPGSGNTSSTSGRTLGATSRPSSAGSVTVSTATNTGSSPPGSQSVSKPSMTTSPPLPPPLRRRRPQPPYPALCS